MRLHIPWDSLRIPLGSPYDRKKIAGLIRFNFRDNILFIDAPAFIPNDSIKQSMGEFMGYFLPVIRRFFQRPVL